MKMTDLFLAELEREAALTRRTLERVPDGRYDWKPHKKSMSLGYLAALVASMPSWVVMTVNQDELDLNSPGGSTFKPQELRTSRELVEALDGNVAKARKALASQRRQVRKRSPDRGERVAVGVGVGGGGRQANHRRGDQGEMSEAHAGWGSRARRTG